MINFIAPRMNPIGRTARGAGGLDDRIQAGEYPASTPARPSGVERNLVVTVYDWGDPKDVHPRPDATDKRKPTVNAYGPIYGATELSTNDLPILDPVRRTSSTR